MDQQQPPHARSAPFDLSGFRVDPLANTVTGPRGEVSVEPKIMAVLLMLADRAGQVVTRQEFLDTVWARESGGDESLTRAISQLRKVLGDARGAQARIETVPRTGYRLVARGTPAPAMRRRALGLALLVVCGILFAGWRLYGARAAPAPDNRDAVIAVLPFDSQSTVEGDVYLAEGLADEILSALSRSQDIYVIAGNSSFKFRGEKKKDLQQIVRQLGVSHVVDGAVRRSGHSVRVGVHLVDARTGLTEWSEVLERSENGVYSIPGSVATAVLAVLGRPPATEAPAHPAGTPDALAYALYLQARALMRETDLPAFERAIGHLEQAVSLEPGLAEAWALLSLSRLSVMLINPGPSDSGYRNRDPEERLAAARFEAQQALALNPEAVDAQLALLVIDYRARLLPLPEAVQRFRQVLERAPNNPNINLRMGMLLNEVGRNRDAVTYLAAAATLDPLTLQGAGIYLQALQHTGQEQKAREFIESGRVPWYPYSYIRLEHALVSADFADAALWLELNGELSYFGPHGVVNALPDNPQDPQRLRALLKRLVLLAEAADEQADPGLPAELIAAADEGLILHYYVAILAAAAGITEPVFQLVLQRLAVDDLFFRGALFRPSLGKLREDPRVMQWFDAGTQLDYWLQTGHWPDFCAAPGLPYDCQQAAREYLATR